MASFWLLLIPYVIILLMCIRPFGAFWKNEDNLDHLGVQHGLKCYRGATIWLLVKDLIKETFLQPRTHIIWSSV